jgi:hypothetical protein
MMKMDTRLPEREWMSLFIAIAVLLKGRDLTCADAATGRKTKLFMDLVVSRNTRIGNLIRPRYARVKHFIKPRCFWIHLADVARTVVMK